MLNAKNINRETAERLGCIMSTLLGLKYLFYLIYHPFDGFWDLKHEKRGNSQISFILIILLLLTMILRRQVTGFIFNNNTPESINFFSETFNVLVPFFLWCIANYAISTLTDGKGTFIDVVMVTAYALTPIIILNLPMLILSNVIVFDERAIYDVLGGISLVWSGLLLLIGMKTIHQFEMFRTVIFILATVLGMAVIAFLSILFLSLVQQMYNFALLIYLELSL